MFWSKLRTVSRVPRIGLPRGCPFQKPWVKISWTRVVGIVLVHLDLFEDDAALAGNFLGGEDGIEDEVGEDVEGGRDVLVQHLHVEADGFLAGEGVEIAADGVDFASDALRGAGFRPFKDHVLDKMRDAIQLRHFVTGAGAHPDAHGDGADVLHAFGEDNESTGKDSTANIAFFSHFGFREEGNLRGRASGQYSMRYARNCG